MKIIALVHDATLIECEEEGAEETIKRAQELMTLASTEVLGPENPIRTEAEIIRYPNRYIDKRGLETWNIIMNLLKDLKGYIMGIFVKSWCKRVTN